MFERLKQSLRRSKDAVFGKMSGLFVRSEIDESLWDELEELLIQADVGFNTTEALLQRVRERVRKEQVATPLQAKGIVAEEMEKLLAVNGSGLALRADGITAILVVGVNGTGKTTTIGKLARHLQRQGRKVLLAAADTFRAAASEQLEIWGERAEVPVIRLQAGADPGAVVFDAWQSAQARGYDTVIVDTAGRLHTKFNLMEEMKKVRRVLNKQDATAPQEVLLVLDATTGQNAIAQAHHFTEAVGVTGIVLAKLDGTAKGGVVFAIAQELRIPIKFVGTGEQMDDLDVFDPKVFVQELLA